MYHISVILIDYFRYLFDEQRHVQNGIGRLLIIAFLGCFTELCQVSLSGHAIYVLNPLLAHAPLNQLVWYDNGNNSHISLN